MEFNPLAPPHLGQRSSLYNALLPAPIDKKGSPVTMHWGYDIIDFNKKIVDWIQKLIIYIN